MRERERKKNNTDIHQTDDISDLDISALIDEINGFLITVLDSCSISINDELFN